MNTQKVKTVKNIVGTPSQVEIGVNALLQQETNYVVLSELMQWVEPNSNRPVFVQQVGLLEDEKTTKEELWRINYEN